MRTVSPFGLAIAALVFGAASVSAHDCDSVLSQGIRNTYQELQTSDVRSAFAKSYCSKSSSSSGRSSGTSGGGSYEMYGFDFNSNSADTSDSRTENCGGESLATSDAKYVNAMRSVADPGIVAAWSACMKSKTGVRILGEVNGSDLVLTYKSSQRESNYPAPEATEAPRIAGAKCDSAVKKGTVIGAGGIIQRCKRDGMQPVTASVNTTDTPALFVLPAPRATKVKFNVRIPASSISPLGYVKYDKDQDMIVSSEAAGGPAENYSATFNVPRAGRYLLEALWASAEQTEVYIFDRPLIGNCQTGVSVAGAVRKATPPPTGGWTAAYVKTPDPVGYFDLVKGSNTLLFATVPCGGGKANGRIPSVRALLITEL